MRYDWHNCYCYTCCREGRVVRRRVNHSYHAGLSLITCGLWLPVWLLCCVVREPWRCGQCGKRHFTIDPHEMGALRYGRRGARIAGHAVY